jgi:tetratricopeptide (TPR) repeat protein
MNATRLLPFSPSASGARVIVLEAAQGAARLDLLRQWAGDARAQGAGAWLLPCDTEREGLWGGLNTWMRELLPEVEARAPDLFVKHDTELTSVLPDLRLRVRPRHVTLTETAEKEEGVRNWAQDRAYRIPQGIVDLLDAWHGRTGGGCWALACDGFDRRGGLVGHFFRQLLRRRGERLGLQMLVAVDPGAGGAVEAELAPFARVERVRLELPAGPEDRLEPDEAARRAAELEAWVSTDSMWVTMHAHEVIRLWNAAGRTDRAADWHALALGIYAHLGYYEDAYRHLPAVRDNLTVFDAPGAFYTRAKVVSNLRIIYITNGQADEALRVMETEGLAWLMDPMDRVHALYVVAMLHARHLPQRNMARGEAHLRQALDEVERAELSPADRAFHTGFLLNGLAYVRFRQGDAAQAAQLSHQNYERLDESLPPERHRLHRSVLLYNAGQVYGQIGDHETAVRYFTAAMEMDPNYSEYYNDRGTILQKLKRWDDAERDYRRAIELSPPYPEVWFNLGQCYLRSGRPAQAEPAYLRALDLDPGRPEAWVNLARARHALGRREDALAAYDGALEVDPANPFVLANRAGLRMELGRPDEALADLDRAVELAPDNAALQRNRVLVLRALGREAALEPAAA